MWSLNCTKKSTIHNHWLRFNVVVGSIVSVDWSCFGEVTDTQISLVSGPGRGRPKQSESWSAGWVLACHRSREARSASFWKVFLFVCVLCFVFVLRFNRYTVSELVLDLFALCHRNVSLTLICVDHKRRFNILFGSVAFGSCIVAWSIMKSWEIQRPGPLSVKDYWTGLCYLVTVTGHKDRSTGMSFGWQVHWQNF